MPNRRSALWAALPALLIIGLIALFFSNRTFFDWAFARHQNPLSWYIRPLFLIPFCFFAYRKSLTGILTAVFLVLTSMFWFPAPDYPDPQMSRFLEMEKAWLTDGWRVEKVILALLIPLLLGILAAAFWRRNRRLGLFVLAFIAAAKIWGSLLLDRQSGTATALPAVIGLLVCIGAVVWATSKHGR